MDKATKVENFFRKLNHYLSAITVGANIFAAVLDDQQKSIDEAVASIYGLKLSPDELDQIAMRFGKLQRAMLQHDQQGPADNV